MKTIAGIFDSNATANSAVSELMAAGFARDDVSLLLSEEARDSFFGSSSYTSSNDTSGKMAKSTLEGATIGGVLAAVAAGLTAVGSVVATGGAVPAAGPIVAVLSGLGIGAVAGGLAGALINAGFSADEANRYAEEIKRGKAVVIVDAEDERRANTARNAFKMAGATNIKA